jgi:hypothetical protein
MMRFVVKRKVEIDQVDQAGFESCMFCREFAEPTGDRRPDPTGASTANNDLKLERHIVCSVVEALIILSNAKLYLRRVQKTMLTV